MTFGGQRLGTAAPGRLADIVGKAGVDPAGDLQCHRAVRGAHRPANQIDGRRVGTDCEPKAVQVPLRQLLDAAAAVPAVGRVVRLPERVVDRKN